MIITAERKRNYWPQSLPKLTEQSPRGLSGWLAFRAPEGRPPGIALPLQLDACAALGARFADHAVNPEPAPFVSQASSPRRAGEITTH
jgi:hypothetical protein